MSEGGLVKSHMTTTSGGDSAKPLSYKRYLMKQRQSAIYTNRPSSRILAEMSAGKHLRSLDRSRFGR